MSPLVWDLAHIANQEEQWLLRAVGGREALRPDIDPLYDAFEHPRAARPSLPLLAPREARTYAAEVRGRVLDVLDGARLEGDPLLSAGFAFGMVAQHEQQHDETMLVTHQLRRGPPRSPRRPRRPPRRTPPGCPPRCWCRAGRSPWVSPTATSRGRWTTSGPRTSASYRTSSSTRCPSPAGRTAASSRTAATATRAGGHPPGGRTCGSTACTPRCSGGGRATGGCAAGSASSNRSRTTNRCCT